MLLPNPFLLSVVILIIIYYNKVICVDKINNRNDAIKSEERRKLLTLWDPSGCKKDNVKTNIKANQNYSINHFCKLIFRK